MNSAEFLEARERLSTVARVTPLIQSKLDPGASLQGREPAGDRLFQDPGRL